MGRSTVQPRRRVSYVALVAALAGLALVGWTVRGLLQDPVPVTAEFGVTAASIAVAGQTPNSDVVARKVAAAQKPSDGIDSPGSANPIAQPETSSAAVPTVEKQVAPVLLTVSDLDLEVTLDAVGVVSDGQMEIPDDSGRAGWYRYGAAPGDDSGSVVVAGHIDDKAGPGAFFALTEVEEGTVVEVELADGTSTAYRVVGGEQVAKASLAVDEIFRQDGDPVLRLVTCTGSWSPRAGHYTENLVITAVPLR